MTFLKMNTRKLLIILLLFTGFTARTQEKPPIGTDRPSQAPSASLIAPYTFQFESGVLYRTFESSRLTSFNSLWRFGVNENFELRAFIDYVRLDRELDGGDGTESGWAPLQLGTKIKISEQYGWLPQASLVAMLALPSGQGSAEINRLIPDLRVTFANDVPGVLDIFYSLGVFWEPSTFKAIGLYTIGTGFTISDRVWSFVEFYGYFNDFAFGPSINGGFTWLAGNNIKIDLTGGLDFPSDGGGFISSGISFRL